MTCKYTGGMGTPPRSVDINYVCDPDVPVPHAAASQVPSTMHYDITVTGVAMCGAVYTPPLSWGSMTLILFTVAAVCYVGGGALYNVKVRERRPTIEEAFPQWAAWRELPGLVKDGCAFSWELVLKAYYQKISHSSAPLDPSLSRRLAEDDGGGGNDRT